MTQQQRAALREISTKISPQIRQLVQNDISENLKSLHNETSLKLMNLSNTMKKSNDQRYNLLIEDRDNITKQHNEIKEMLEITIQNQNEIVKRETSFSKVCRSLEYFLFYDSSFQNEIKKFLF